MAENFSRNILRIVIAQLSQGIGFDTIQSSSLDILTNVLERYMLMVGKSIHDFSEQRGQTVPELGDVEFALKQLHISLPDILDYTQQMEPIAFAHRVAKFPAPKESNLNFPSGNNPEDFNRGEHIPLYMPSMTLAPEKPIPSEQDAATLAESQQTKKGSFVIAGKHPQGSSSDEDDYSAGDLSNEEFMSDDSLSHNPLKSRHLTRPEDIPTVEGTAPSSLMSVPSVSELDELRSLSPSRRTSFEGVSDRGKDKRTPGDFKFSASRKPGKSNQDLPWLSPDRPASNRKAESNKRTPSHESNDPDWLTERKKSQDIYDPGWMHDDAASPVHLTKPPTPDAISGVSSKDKRSWHEKDRRLSSMDSTKSERTSDSLGTPFGKSKIGHSLSTPSQRNLPKASVDRKLSHHKSYKPGHKVTPSSKKMGASDDPLKARIEAADRLIQNAPVAAYKPSSPKQTSRKTSQQGSKKSPVRTSIERAESLLKHPPVENLTFPSSRELSPSVSKHEKEQAQQKQIKSNFASPKSMYDAIDAVINRFSEETRKRDELAKKEAEEAELMKFSHLVKDSSSSDSESDVSHKEEQMLQLQERGLQQPPTPESSPVPSPSSDLSMDEDIKVDSDSDSEVVIPPKILHDTTPSSTKSKSKSEKQSKKEKHKKKSKHKTDDSGKLHSGTKSKKDKHSTKPSSFVTTETISEKPVKVKVKFKHYEADEPKLFDVDRDKDRIKITTETKHKSKDDKQKSKDGKHKSKEHKKHGPKLSTESKQSSGEHDMSVEKIVLKKSKSGDTKVVKPKIKEHNRSPSPISNRSNLPLPKLSAAVPVLSVTATVREKEKKKSKKEKKKKKDKDLERGWFHDKDRSSEKSRRESKDKSHQKEKYRDSDWDSRPSSRRESFDSDVSSPVVPKLTLKMGTSEKKFVIKPSGSSTKQSSKKRSHSSVGESPIPLKERKVSVESVKTVSGGFAAAVERKVITQTISAGPVGVYKDADGNKIWICPGCNKPDDGSPMIGCDTCDDWYHWPCVRITEEPPENQDWYCPRCIKRQQLTAKGKLSAKKRKKK